MDRDFSYLRADQAFLDPDRADANTPGEAKCVVIPFGLEHSVSYGNGTARGPVAILEASHQLELFDDETWRCPCDEFGIATLDVGDIDVSRGLVSALEHIEGLVEGVLAAGRFPFVLGGEHALSAGAIRPFARRHDKLVVLQIDAHADLRDGYLGEHYSHASAMRRALDHDNVSVVGVGIRAFCEEEANFYLANRDRITLFFGKDQADWDIEKICEPLKGQSVYVTFDIDGLDQGVMPATGTPTPGGLDYLQALKILRRASEVCDIVGADLVELAPIPNFHSCDFLAAQLAYKIMGYALSVKPALR